MLRKARSHVPRVVAGRSEHPDITERAFFNGRKVALASALSPAYSRTDRTIRRTLKYVTLKCSAAAQFSFSLAKFRKASFNLTIYIYIITVAHRKGTVTMRQPDGES